MNRLYYGDCLTIMQEWPLACVDLIYLDPPFNSNRQYNAIYKDETGRPLPDQIEAFCDMWELDPERERAIRTMPVLMRENGIDDAIAEFWRLWMNALRGTQPRLLAYLSYMAERLLIMRRILKPTGSLYFHCDSTVNHYVKPLLDAVFGHTNFRSDITWRRINSTGRGSKRYANNSDNILYYARGSTFTWHQPFKPHTASHLGSKYRHADEDTGRRYSLGDLKGKGLRQGSSGLPWRDINPSEIGSHWAIPSHGIPQSAKALSAQEKLDMLDETGRIYWPPKGGRPRYKRYLDEMQGTPIDTIWDDISPINSQAAERMGYATQKPLALLERIIAASSNPGDVVLDPFCGCATTMEAAQKLGREWIGIDIAIHAIKRVARVRLTPNPPKDTDGRREESGRGGEGATGEIAWVPFGVGRSADGLHRRTGAPMAVCGSCDARDGERIRSRELSRTGLARVCGDLRLSGGWVADGAVRPGVEWLAAGPRRG